MRGGKGALLIDNAAGTPQDVTAFTDSVEWGEFTTETLDNTVWGQNAKSYESGLGDGAVSAGGKFPGGAAGATTNLVATTMRAIRGVGPLTVEWRPEGSGLGKPFRRVEALLTSYKESAPVGEIITWSAEWQVSGDETTGNQ